MSDFASRLEAELLRAAAREQRRPWGMHVPRLRPHLPTVLAVAATACAIVVFGLAVTRLPGPRPTHPSPPPSLAHRLAGEYAGTGPTALLIDNGRYTLLLARGARVTGDATLHGNVLALGNDGDGACGTDPTPARYRIRLHADQLTLKRLTDTCRSRSQALTDQPLRRR